MKCYLDYSRILRLRLRNLTMRSLALSLKIDIIGSKTNSTLGIADDTIVDVKSALELLLRFAYVICRAVFLVPL